MPELSPELCALAITGLVIFLTGLLVSAPNNGDDDDDDHFAF